MSDTTNFTMRIPTDLAAALDVRAAQAGTNRHQFILNLLSDELEPSTVILGRWQVYASEFEECADCHQPLASDDTWLGVMADGRIFGPLCGGCARDD